VALISAIFVALATRLLGRRGALWPALGAIAWYALLVGGEASVVRASIMGGLLVTATALQRRSTALVSLAAACMAMTMVNPLALWDLGLQLSASASAGLILMMPAAGRWLQQQFGSRHAWLRIAGEDILAVSLIASASILPLVLYQFGRLSLVSVLSNLLIAPVQPLILLGGSAALFVGLIGQQVCAQVLFWLPWLGLAWTVAVVRWSAALPFAAVDVPNFGFPHMVLVYGAIGAVRWRQALWNRVCALAEVLRPNGNGPRPVSLRHFAGALLVTPAALTVAAALMALVWIGVLAQPDGRLHVWFLDVGQGDGIFIQTPSGRQVLLDGGAGGQVLLGELGSVMPFWDRTLDLLVLTHSDADHMAAQAEAAGRYHVGAAWETPAAETDPSSNSWRKAVEAAGADVQIQHAGGWADLGDGVALWVLGPAGQGYRGEDADNENSLVARLVYGDFSVLLTGDAGAAAERALLAQGAPLTSTVLKVAHHGSDSSTGDAFVRAVNPQLAIIQVAADNTYGHPNSQVLDRLAGRTVLRNDRDGRVHVWSDGTSMWLTTENAPSAASR
jgi:competence protein ComEC